MADIAFCFVLYTFSLHVFYIPGDVLALDFIYFALYIERHNA